MPLEQILAHIPPGSPDEAIARQVDFARLPAHIAIIMDGNGRWAAKRHLPRVEGRCAAPNVCTVGDVIGERGLHRTAGPAERLVAGQRSASPPRRVPDLSAALL